MIKLNDEQIYRVKEIISVEVLRRIKDKSIENVLRNIIFNPYNTIDWDDVLYQIHVNMPEITMK
jgi:hypothetical protein